MRIGVEATCWNQRRGYGRHLRSLLPALIETEPHDEYIVFLDGPGPDLYPVPPAARVVRVAVTRPTLAAASGDSHRSLTDVWAMSRALSSARLAHEHRLVCPVNVLWKNARAACDSPTCFSCTVRSARPPQLWRYTPLLERAASHVDLFLTPSRFSREEHRRRGFSGEMQILPYFASPFGGGSNGNGGQPAAQAFDANGSAPSGAPHARPYFLFVGRLEKIKGVQEILPHFKGPGHYDLLVVGAGRYEAELHRQARGMERVRFVGWKNQDQLGDYYRHALGLVVPSQTYETFGIVVIEAFAHHKPVIVNNLGALPELVEESGGGLVYQGRRQMGEQLDRLAGDLNLRGRLGERGHRALREKWSAGPHIDRYESLIRQVNEQHRDADSEPRAKARGQARIATK